MLGKTNIIYVTKNQNSEMQFVAETIVTRSSSDIKKMKYLNEIFFAFTSENTVLYGEDINDLSFLRNGEQLMTASNVEYFDGKFIFTNNSTNFLYYYVSEDLSSFQQFELPAVNEISSTATKKMLDIVIDSYNRLVFLVNIKSAASYFYIFICTDPVDKNSFEILKSTESVTLGYYIKGITFMRDRFLVNSYENDSKRYCHCITMDAVVEKVDVNHYPIGIVNDMAYASAESNTYYSLNFKDYIKIKSDSITQCFVIGGRIGLYNEGILELASKVTDFTSGKSTELEITGIDYEVLCYVTADEYTFLGCKGGIIIQCLLDVEGTYQMPEITLVKTLAAKEALEQAKKYTDKKCEELKAYVDSLD